MRTWYFSERAERDVEEIVSYLVEVAGPNAARKVAHRILEKCRLLASAPGGLGTARPELGVGIDLRSFPVSSYLLFFRYSDVSMEVVRVLHERRDVETILREDEDT